MKIRCQPANIIPFVLQRRVAPGQNLGGQINIVTETGGNTLEFQSGVWYETADSMMMPRAIATGATSAVENRSRRAKVSGFDMLGVPLWEYAVCKKGGEAPIHAPPPLLRSGADQVVGMAVQLPLALPKLAVTELQVQPAYQVSLLSLTAPT